MIISSPVISPIVSGILGFLGNRIRRILFVLSQLTVTQTPGTGGATVWVRDSTGALVLKTLPSGTAAFPGLFYAETVADGATPGSELCQNGGFDADTSWTKEAAWTISDGVLKCSATGDTQYLSQPITFVYGAVYELKYDLLQDTLSGSGFGLSNRGPVVGACSLPRNIGINSFTFTAATSASIISFYASMTNSGDGFALIDNMSIKRVTPRFLPNLPDGTPCHPTYTLEGKTFYHQYPAWTAGETVAAGAKRNKDGVWLECTVGGTCGTTLTVPAIGASVVDGGATWLREATNYYASGEGRVLTEPGATNKVTCRKQNPVDLSNTVKTGDTQATLSIVDDAAALAVAGLSKVCTSGKVYKIDHSVGSSWSEVDLSGAVGNVNPHVATAYVRTNGGEAQFRFGLVTGTKFSNTAYQKVTFNRTPTSTSETIAILAEIGTVVYFILPALVEAATMPSIPLYPTDTLSAVTRTASIITAPVASVIPASGNDFWMLIEGEVTRKLGIHNVLVSAVGTTDELRIYLDGSTGVFTVQHKIAGVSDYPSLSAITPVANIPTKIKAIVRKSSVSGLGLFAAGASNKHPEILSSFGDLMVSTCYIGSRSGKEYHTNGTLNIQSFPSQITDANAQAYLAGTKTLQEVLYG